MVPSPSPSSSGTYSRSSLQALGVMRSLWTWIKDTRAQILAANATSLSPAEHRLQESPAERRTKPGTQLQPLRSASLRLAPFPRARSAAPKPGLESRPESGCSGIKVPEDRALSQSFPRSCYTRTPQQVPPSLPASQDSDIDVKLTRRQRTLQTAVRAARRRQCQLPASLQA